MRSFVLSGEKRASQISKPWSQPKLASRPYGGDEAGRLEPRLPESLGEGLETVVEAEAVLHDAVGRG